MARKKNPKKPVVVDSPALELMRCVWCKRRIDSWAQLNGVLQNALALAIEAKLEFGPDDFRSIYALFRGGYWMGSSTEHWYAKAVKVGHRSACQAYEAWVKRPPMMFNRKRVAVGTGIVWQNEALEVTSFGHDFRGHYVGCVRRQNGKVVKKLKLTRVELKAGAPDDGKPKPSPDIGRFNRTVGRELGGGCIRVFLRKHLSLLAAWNACEDNHVYTMHSLLKLLKFPIYTHEESNLRTAEAIRARVGNAEQTLLPLVLEQIRFMERTMKKAKTTAEDSDDEDED